MTRRETKSYPIAGLKAIDTETGQFEAIVSVFGNVDLHGHRIDSHAFDASIDRWRASGDPIPVIFSHQWDDLSAYLGTINPDNLEALQPGDDRLPDGLKDFGGLFVAGQLDTTEPEGRKAAKLLKSRAVREFSFAYDVFDEAKGDDGHLDLLELDILEIGPTLKGANPLTQLVSAKSAPALEEIAEAFGLKASEAAELVAATAALAAGDTEPATKAQVRLAGTIEALQAELTRQAQVWAADEYGANLYAVALEGTFTDSAVVYVELWDDPVGGGRYFEAGYTVEDGTVTLGDLTPVDIVAETRPKTRPAAGLKEGRRNASSDQTRLQSIHDLTRELGAECADADADGEASEEDGDTPDGTESRDPWSIRTSIDAELLEL